MARQRDYKAEYAARIAKGQAQGLSRAQAAGHPKLGEPLKTQLPLPPMPAPPAPPARQRSEAERVTDLRGTRTRLTVESYTDEKHRPHNKEGDFIIFKGGSMGRLEKVIDMLADTHPDGKVRIAVKQKDEEWDDALSIWRHGQRADTTAQQMGRYGGGAGLIGSALGDAYGDDSAEAAIDPYDLDWELSIEDYA